MISQTSWGALRLLKTIRLACSVHGPAFAKTYVKPLFDKIHSLQYIHTEQYYGDGNHAFHEGTLSYFSDRYTREDLLLDDPPESLFTLWDDWKRW